MRNLLNGSVRIANAGCELSINDGRRIEALKSRHSVNIHPISNNILHVTPCMHASAGGAAVVRSLLIVPQSDEEIRVSEFFEKFNMVCAQRMIYTTPEGRN